MYFNVIHITGHLSVFISYQNVGAIHGGIGCTTVNKAMSSINIDTISDKVFKCYEKKLAPLLRKLQKTVADKRLWKNDVLFWEISRNCGTNCKIFASLNLYFILFLHWNFQTICQICFQVNCIEKFINFTLLRNRWAKVNRNIY